MFIIKDIKAAPAPGLPRIWAILISRSRLIHGLFLFSFGHFFTGAALLGFSTKQLIGFEKDPAYRPVIVSLQISVRIFFLLYAACVFNNNILPQLPRIERVFQFLY